MTTAGLMVVAMAATTPSAGAGEILEGMIFRDQDGLQLAGDLYLPEGTGPHPTVVLVHGGAFVSGSRTDGAMRGWAKTLQQHGYAAWSIDMRLNHDMPPGSVVWPASLDDVQCAVRWLKGQADRWDLDPTRVYALGGSAGGWYAAMLAVAPSVGGRCPGGEDQDSSLDGSVVFFAPSHWGSLFDTRARGQGGGTGAIQAETTFVGSTCLFADERSANCFEASPAVQMHSSAPPMFIAHSADDPAIPYQQSQLLFTAARDAGVDATWRPVGALGHGWHSRFNQPPVALVRDEVLDWLDALASTEDKDEPALP